MNDYLTFDESIDYLENLYRQPHIPAARAELERAAFLLDQLGNPHLDFRSVHVAGSSGKGSTTTMIGSILQAAGYRTGYFRSPHLHSYRERIAVDDQDIDIPTWEHYFNVVRPVVEAMRLNALAGYELGRPVLFEVLFAMAALYFRDTGIEWAVVETGLGGRLDATNLLPADVAVVTNVSLEHTQILGDTVAAIAREKAAIIKPGCRAVTASRDPAALQIIGERAVAVGVPLLHVGRDIRVQVVDEQLGRQNIILSSLDRSLGMTLPLNGQFQAENAATAYAVVEALREIGLPICDAAVMKGLRVVKVPGRFEVLGARPTVVLDGAHNPEAAVRLATAVARVVSDQRIILLFAAMADKDIPAMARALGPLATTAVLTVAPGTPRAASLAQLIESFGSAAPCLRAVPDVDKALASALGEASADDVLLVTGSLYLVGSVREALLTAGVRW